MIFLIAVLFFIESAICFNQNNGSAQATVRRNVTHRERQSQRRHRNSLVADISEFTEKTPLQDYFEENDGTEDPPENAITENISSNPKIRFANSSANGIASSLFSTRMFVPNPEIETFLPESGWNQNSSNSGRNFSQARFFGNGSTRSLLASTVAVSRSPRQTSRKSSMAELPFAAMLRNRKAKLKTAFTNTSLRVNLSEIFSTQTSRCPRGFLSSFVRIRSTAVIGAAVTVKHLDAFECALFCRNNSDPRDGRLLLCQGFNFAEGENQQCQLIDRSRPIREINQDMGSRESYFDKVCLLQTESAAFCDKRHYSFEAVLNAHLRGNVAKTISNISGCVACMQACLDETSFRCQSANYFQTTGLCELSRYSRRNKPADFLTNVVGIDYFENNCLTHTKRCEHGDVFFAKAVPNEATTDLTLASNASRAAELEKCLENCLLSDDLFCRSAQIVGEGHCLISDEDSFSMPELVDDINKNGLELFEPVCLAGTEELRDQPCSRPFLFQKRFHARLHAPQNFRVLKEMSTEDCLSTCLRKAQTCILSEFDMHSTSTSLVANENIDYYENKCWSSSATNSGMIRGCFFTLVARGRKIRDQFRNITTTPANDSMACKMSCVESKCRTVSFSQRLGICYKSELEPNSTPFNLLTETNPDFETFTKGECLLATTPQAEFAKKSSQTNFVDLSPSAIDQDRRRVADQPLQMPSNSSKSFSPSAKCTYSFIPKRSLLQFYQTKILQVHSLRECQQNCQHSEAFECNILAYSSNETQCILTNVDGVSNPDLIDLITISSANFDLYLKDACFPSSLLSLHVSQNVSKSDGRKTRANKLFLSSVTATQNPLPPPERFQEAKDDALEVQATNLSEENINPSGYEYPNTPNSGTQTDTTASESRSQGSSLGQGSAGQTRATTRTSGASGASGASSSSSGGGATGSRNTFRTVGTVPGGTGTTTRRGGSSSREAARTNGTGGTSGRSGGPATAQGNATTRTFPSPPATPAASKATTLLPDYEDYYEAGLSSEQPSSSSVTSSGTQGGLHGPAVTQTASAPVGSEGIQLQALCRDEGVNVTVKAARPYTGAIYAAERYSFCRNLVTKQNSFWLYLPRPSVNSACNTIMVNNVLTGVVVVSADNIVPFDVTTKDDLFYQITCDYSKTETAPAGGRVLVTSGVVVGGPTPRVIAGTGVGGGGAGAVETTLRILRNGQPVQNVLIGEKLTFKVETSSDTSKIYLTACNVTRVGGTGPAPEPLRLIEDGCPALPQVIGPVTRVQKGLQANLVAFRIDGSAEIQFVCLVQFCRQECPTINCGGRSDNDDTADGGRERRRKSVDVIFSEETDRKQRQQHSDQLQVEAVQGNLKVFVEGEEGAPESYDSVGNGPTSFQKHCIPETVFIATTSSLCFLLFLSMAATVHLLCRRYRHWAKRIRAVPFWPPPNQLGLRPMSPEERNSASMCSLATTSTTADSMMRQVRRCPTRTDSPAFVSNDAGIYTYTTVTNFVAND